MKLCVTLVQPPGYIHSLAFLETAKLVCLAAKSLRYPVRFEVNRLHPDAWNVVFGYHLLRPEHFSLVKTYRCAAYQMEQFSDRGGRFNEEIEQRLQAFPLIWDYSSENVSFLQARGFPAVRCVPLGFHPGLRQILRLPDFLKDVDVLFYGCLNERRNQVLRQLHGRCRLKILFGCYGDERDRWIARSKIVLNIHYYEARILEQARLSYLLNNRRFVISEDSEPNIYEGGMVTGELDQLAELCLDYLKKPTERRRIAGSGYELFRSRPFTESLRHVVAALDSEPSPSLSADTPPEPVTLSWPAEAESNKETKGRRVKVPFQFRYG